MHISGVHTLTTIWYVYLVQCHILSDILGDEDHLGDMDFKTTGTRDGLTATQMDIKCDGLSFEILEEALMQAMENYSWIVKGVRS